MTLPDQLDVEVAMDHIEALVRDELPEIAYPADRFRGCGVVIAVSGIKFQDCA